MLLLGIVLLVVIGLFVLDNNTPVTVEFLRWRYNSSLGLSMLAAFVLGAIIIYVSGVATQARLRAQLRNAEARLRESEKQLKAAAQQIPQITYGERE